MTQQSAFAIALPQISDIHNAVLAVLDGAATQIKRFAAAIHNRCPLVVYIDKAGRTCSQFLARSLFTGYHFTLGNGVAVVTNRETGTQYKVSLNTLYCSCKAFLYSPLPKKPCKHINLVAQFCGETGLEQVIATSELDQYIEQQGQAIAPALLDENDVPHGCFLTRTEDYISREYNVHIHVIESARGHEWLTTKCVGRVIENINGIQVFQLRSGIYHTFQDTHSAARCLITTNGYRLADIAAAYEAHLDAQF